jgi:murein DD-endopeptidase MepM/ murein hydrolase activator NlpD
MRMLVSILIALATLAGGCAARATTATTATAATMKAVAAEELAQDAAAPREAQEPGEGVVHIVQPGQTLWRIARAYDIELDKLAEANGIDDPTRVAVGTPIFIPGATATIEVAAYPAPLPSVRGRDVIHPEPTADFLWPVSGGAFMRPFGEPRRHHVHAGVDIRGELGQDILAARDGVVAFGGNTKTGYGTMVILDHGDGVQTVYAHAEKILVRQGDAVRRGQPIALLGRTGNATTEHCHFEIRLANHAVDPMPYLLGMTEAHR